MDCQYPQNAPRTGYDKGCRCDRCRDAKADAVSRWRAANPGRERERLRAWRAADPERERERLRAWRAADPEKARAYKRAWDAANRVEENERKRKYYVSNSENASRSRKAVMDRYQACSAASATVSGRWTAAEDLVVIQWEGTVLHLAFALGRTYGSTVGRIDRLRARGVKLKRDEL